MLDSEDRHFQYHTPERDGELTIWSVASPKRLWMKSLDSLFRPSFLFAVHRCITWTRMFLR